MVSTLGTSYVSTNTASVPITSIFIQNHQLRKEQSRNSNVRDDLITREEGREGGKEGGRGGREGGREGGEFHYLHLYMTKYNSKHVPVNIQ